MLPFSETMTFVTQRDLPWEMPAQRLAAWCARDGATALVSDGGDEGRYSYLTALPEAVTTIAEDLIAALDQLKLQAPATPHLPPFSGGVIGVAGFELGLRLENLSPRPFRIEGQGVWPDLVLVYYPAVLAFDHHRQTLTAVGRGATHAQAEAARDALIDLFHHTPHSSPLESALVDAPLRCETPDPVHEDKVTALIRQIHAGDLFQANLARGWTGRLRKDVGPHHIFARLQSSGASPFGAFMRFGQRAIVSNSPERFIRLLPDGQLISQPIKGTRPRGLTPDEDAVLAKDLSLSEKDRAENLMIVDLMRHDVSRVSEPGSVRVPELNALKSFASVHHLVSTVTAQILPGKHAGDVLRATFPPGSITGAPKVQAMKVIRDMEAPRGPYCGALFWIDAAGAMDSSVLIRTLACEQAPDGVWHIRAAAGGGIVADSDPVSERKETEVKLALIRQALEGPSSPS